MGLFVFFRQQCFRKRLIDRYFGFLNLGCFRPVLQVHFLAAISQRISHGVDNDSAFVVSTALRFVTHVFFSLIYNFDFVVDVMKTLDFLAFLPGLVVEQPFLQITSLRYVPVNVPEGNGIGGQISMNSFVVSIVRRVLFANVTIGLRRNAPAILYVRTFVLKQFYPFELLLFVQTFPKLLIIGRRFSGLNFKVLNLYSFLLSDIFVANFRIIEV